MLNTTGNSFNCGNAATIASLIARAPCEPPKTSNDKRPDSQLKELPVVLSIKHQTGAADFEKVNAAYAAAGWNEQAQVHTYIDNMMDDFAAADLVICRAGATTTAELIAAGKASIMIPFPYAADDHQRKNAEAL